MFYADFRWRIKFNKFDSNNFGDNEKFQINLANKQLYR